MGPSCTVAVDSAASWVSLVDHAYQATHGLEIEIRFMQIDLASSAQIYEIEIMFIELDLVFSAHISGATKYLESILKH